MELSLRIQRWSKLYFRSLDRKANTTPVRQPCRADSLGLSSFDFLFLPVTHQPIHSFIIHPSTHPPIQPPIHPPIYPSSHLIFTECLLWIHNSSFSCKKSTSLLLNSLLSLGFNDTWPSHWVFQYLGGILKHIVVENSRYSRGCSFHCINQY